jgi:single-strand DNA-binding protein
MCSEDRWWIRAQEKTLWHNIAIWNDTHGEVAMKYLRKGSQAYVEGQIETRSWENDWQKHYATEVVLRPFNSELLLLNKAERPAAQPAQRRERGAEPS